MLNGSSTKLQAERWMAIFLPLHLLAWTLVPYFVRFALPLDAMEGTTWGHQLELGYDKNPFLNGWLSALAVFIDDYQDWASYLFSQLSIVICFVAVWQLAKKMLPPLYALIAVLILEGVQYYNLHAIDFNDNTLELALWALTALWFYNALTLQRLLDWLLVGVFAGLGMMAKYYTTVLLLPMFLFLIFYPANRQNFLRPQIYMGLAAFVATVLPHFVWLFFHDFVTVEYAVRRVSTQPTWINHIEYSGRFAWQQIEAFIPALALGLMFLFGRNPKVAEQKLHLSQFDKQFLFYVGVGPFILTVLLSAITGIKLRAGWGTPLLSLWGIILMAWLSPYVTQRRFYRFLVVFFALFAATVVGYATALIRADEPSSANFPGRVMANVLTREWHETFHTPLPFVAGSRWVAGNVAHYSKDHPSVYINWNKKLSPWINEDDLRHKGALFVWDMSEPKESLTPEIQSRFANLGAIKIMHFSWMRNRNAEPIEVAVAYLPPSA